MPDPSYYATIGRENGRRLRGAVRHNLRCFWRAVDRRGIERADVRERAETYEDVLDGSTRQELVGLAETSGLDYRDLVAFNLFEESVQPDGCTVAIAVGEAAASGDTVFFKQSDKKGADEFEGEEYHEHQQINVIRIENPDDANKTVSVAAAGSTA
ncbi:MAG: hypothetical protein R3324_05240, partial [Halobacteriales archaeon]|nr:hypothetical protein [Halobacteriales archaeon]